MSPREQFLNRQASFGYVKYTVRWQYILRISAYTLLLLLMQAHWISRLPYRALRIDLMLPLMFGVAIESPPMISLGWAFLWGYVMDTLSGKFWGFHVGSYVVSICLVNIAAEKFEFQNPIYQMAFVGMCALGQSFILGLFLLFEPSGSMDFVSTWHSLAIRAFLMMIVTPMVIFPVVNDRRSGK